MASIASTPQGRAQTPEWTVWLTVAVALILGLVLQMVVQGKTQTGQVAGSSVVYPASWVQTTEPGAGFAAADTNGSGSFGPRVSLREVDQKTLYPNVIGLGAGSSSLLDAATAWSLQRGKDLVGYRVLDIAQATVQGRPAVNVESVYLLDAAQGAGTNTIPGLLRVVDTVVASGDKYYILTFGAESSQFDQLQDLHQKLLDDWRIP